MLGIVDNVMTIIIDIMMTAVVIVAVIIIVIGMVASISSSTCRTPTYNKMKHVSMSQQGNEMGHTNKNNDDCGPHADIQVLEK